MVDRSEENTQRLPGNCIALSGEERIIIGAQMFDSFRERIKASLPPGLSETEQRREVFKRIYGEKLPKN
jgi:hypothetical protein